MFLNNLQIRCFDAPLQPKALQDVKNIVEHHTPLGVCNDGLTLEGIIQSSLVWSVCPLL